MVGKNAKLLQKKASDSAFRFLLVTVEDHRCQQDLGRRGALFLGQGLLVLDDPHPGLPVFKERQVVGLRLAGISHDHFILSLWEWARPPPAAFR